ncbi:MAG: 30S ribosomal protein S9 [Candidatus Moranbacteria bacterium GW2011_GWF1_44_4]|nr:MAG: 30S ribosomal protein S9 [Candidatus Moranbacteria bacterium GW2011_GWF1_44_4]
MNSMAKKEPVKKKKVQEEKKVEKAAKRRYFHGLGRRKSAITSVKIIVSKEKFKIPDSIKINNRTFLNYFPFPELQRSIASPFLAVGFEGDFEVNAVAKGGGPRGQAEAMRLAISKALVNYNEANKKTLRDLGYLTRDARKVERKKAGLRKARRAPQFSKR